MANTQNISSGNHAKNDMVSKSSEDLGLTKQYSEE